MASNTTVEVGRFGPYGGRFVAETLIPALDELARAYADARGDAEFEAERHELLAHYVGRPTPLYRAAGLSADTGLEVWLKREDLCHTGAHKVNNTIGQVLLARRMGKNLLRRHNRCSLGHLGGIARPRQRGVKSVCRP